MLGFIQGLTSTVAAVLGAIAGGAVTAAIVFLYATIVMVPHAHHAGALQERAAWQEATRKAKAAQEHERQKAQDKIDAVEQDYLDRTQSLAVQNSALQQALDQERKSHEKDHSGSVLDRTCIPVGVSDAIAKTGRPDAAGKDPAQ